jgi:predicted DNA-binding transcriptional regulator AlpA
VASFASCFNTAQEVFMGATAARRHKASAEKAKRYLRKWEVAKRYGVTGRTIERMSADGWLPQPIRLGARVLLWDEALLDERDARAEASSAPPEAQIRDQELPRLS